MKLCSMARAFSILFGDMIATHVTMIDYLVESSFPKFGLDMQAAAAEEETHSPSAHIYLIVTRFAL